MISPEGGGYPALPISPYLDAGKMDCYLVQDGAVILDSTPPPYDWPILGGVAGMLIFPGPDIPSDVSQGQLTRPSSEKAVLADDIEFRVQKYNDYTLSQLLSGLLLVISVAFLWIPKCRPCLSSGARRSLDE